MGGGSGNHFWRIMGTYKYTEEYDAYIQVYRVIVFFQERQLTFVLSSDGGGGEVARERKLL